MWGTLVVGRIYANASQSLADATWFHQTSEPHNEDLAHEFEVIPWGDMERCDAIGVLVHRIQAHGFILHWCLLTDKNALPKHCTCLGVGETTLFQDSKRALLSSCWVFLGSLQLRQTAGSVPMRHKNWPTQLGFTKHPAPTLRTVRSKLRQSPGVISSDAMRLASRCMESRRMDSLCIGSCRPTRTLSNKAPYLSWRWRGNTFPSFKASFVIQLLGF